MARRVHRRPSGAHVWVIVIVHGQGQIVKVKIKGSRQGQEIPFTQTKIKDRSETLTRNTGPQNLLRATANESEHGQVLNAGRHCCPCQRVSDKVRFIFHGLSRTVSNRPVCIQLLPHRQLAQLPTKMSYYSSILSHIHIHIY